MRHFLLTSGLICCVLLLTGAVDRHSLCSATPGVEPFLPTAAAGDAAGLMDHVLAALGDPRVQWLETSIRQRMLGEEPFEAEGRLVQAPGQRVRLELKIRAGGKEARVLAVSDGRRLWQTRTLDGKDENATVEPLPPLAPQNLQARTAFLEGHGLSAPLSLLREIRPALQGATQQPGTFRGQPAIFVSGRWQNPEEVLQTVPARLRARRCNIILDARTFWPLRVEWIGSPKPRDYPALLLQIDFSRPIINHVLTEDECRREFRL